MNKATRRVKAISFDFWNTLFAEQEGGFKLYQDTRRQILTKVLGEQGLSFTAEQVAAAAHQEAESHHLIWIQEHRTLVAAERLQRVLTRLNTALPADICAQVVAAYEDGILERPPTLVEGAREVIEGLAGRFRLGIISDIGFSPGRVLRQVMQDAGILNYFDSLIFSDEAGRSKPHREVFEQTRLTLRAAPQEIVHIGDLEHTDIVGANNAGFHSIRFVGVTPLQAGETSDADYVTTDLREVPQIVEAIENQLER